MPSPPPSRALNERTGRHYCVKCLKQIAAEEYLRNDHICDACAATDEYPLASTPHAKDEGGRMKDE